MHLPALNKQHLARRESQLPSVEASASAFSYHSFLRIALEWLSNGSRRAHFTEGAELIPATSIVFTALIFSYGVKERRCEEKERVKSILCWKKLEDITLRFAVKDW